MQELLYSSVNTDYILKKTMFRLKYRKFYANTPTKRIILRVILSFRPDIAKTNNEIQMPVSMATIN